MSPEVPAGWYPDPGKQPGMFRYWDGAAWSAAVSSDPQAPPPPGSKPAGPRAEPSASGQPHLDPEPRRGGGSIGVWIGAGAALLVLLLIIMLAVRMIGGGGDGPDPDRPPGPQPQAETCPSQSDSGSLPPPEPHPADGRVHGGKLSFPELGAPWGPISTDYRVPFGRDVHQQTVTTQPNYEPGASWQASLMVAQLYAGDGFYAPEEASEIVVDCIVGAFYGDNLVERDDTVNEARELDGHEGWYVESELSFDIDGLNTDGELLMVWIVQTSELSSSLYYASVPNDVRGQLEPDARSTMEQLQVSA